jgi:hypothetical protein
MLRDKKAGVVINVASEAGMQGSSGQARKLKLRNAASKY